MKSAQSTIKILMKSDFSSDLTPFSYRYWGIGPSGGMGVQPNIGGSGIPLKRYKVTPLQANHK